MNNVKKCKKKTKNYDESYLGKSEKMMLVPFLSNITFQF